VTHKIVEALKQKVVPWIKPTHSLDYLERIQVIKAEHAGPMAFASSRPT
jgi:antirestriction protein ArdC